MPAAFGRPACRGITASAPSELAWLLDLLTQSAPYAEPALVELEANLLPGLLRLRRPMLERAGALWSDGLAGCPELVPLASLAGALLDGDVRRLVGWLGEPKKRFDEPTASLTDSERDRPAVVERLRALTTDPATRRGYRAMLLEVWELASGPWMRQGAAVVAAACRAWRDRLDTGASIEELMPPRHPLTRAEELGFGDLFSHRTEFVLSPLFFCMSGGHVVDLAEFVHVAVPASDLLPVRKTRDAMFVASRLRVLSEPTRVRILLQLLSVPAGAVEVARALGVSQPTVSGHLKVLLQAGLIQRKKLGGRSVMVASRKRVERLVEDARATIVRWD
ncbi:MAG TPA: winged helix-turn-helix domain-containing protein [Myxococcaceae bacterium]